MSGVAVKDAKASRIVVVMRCGWSKTSRAVKRRTRRTPGQFCSSLKRRTSRSWALRVPWNVKPSISTTSPAARK
ncbi:hypothetical protein RGF97_11125 [Streptomyces roseicoloratus]|uniref:Uncharacterized protein n=1 Tax=Streptomyces roseicoloratus TaxID=2508722 RepID=A0ABY9RSZ3_9ACTN|nr:hypothetical protein [Streptomyces roseicoloratus]WMX45295.1 hypothetical protein RGF97_11125 [Streptomyces roseicoloratus]